MLFGVFSELCQYIGHNTYLIFSNLVMDICLWPRCVDICILKKIRFLVWCY